MSGVTRILTMVLLLLPGGSLAGSSSHGPGTVLVIYTNERLLPANVMFDTSFRKAFEASGSNVEIFSEFLGAPRFRREAERASFGEYLSGRYSIHHPDAVVAVGAPALDFLLRNHELFRDAAIVAGACPSSELRALQTEAGFAAVPLDLAIDKVLEAVMRMHPDTEHVYVISGGAAQDRVAEAVARDQLQRSAHAEKIEYLSELPIPEIERRLASPPQRRSAAIYLSVLLDGDGVSHYSADVLERLAATTNIPIYGIYETYLGSGVVGGVVSPLELHGAETAQLVLRVLDGESAESIGITEGTKTLFILDDRQVKRWRLNRSRIPQDAELRFATPSPWDLYRREIILGASLILVQFLLIALLVFERKRRGRAERRLKSEAKKLQLVTNSVPALIAQIDSEGRYVFANESYRSWWRVDPSSLPGRSIEQVIGEDVYASIRTYVARALAGERVQYNMQTRLADGSTRDIEALYVPDIDADGLVRGFYSLVLDVSDEKQAEREKRVLQSELAHASRVSVMGELAAALAHELNQPLTAIMSNAQAAQRFVDRDKPDLDEVRSILEDIVADDRRASEVIRGLREFLKKGSVEVVALDLNHVASDVVRFVEKDLDAKEIALDLSLDESIPMVSGDRVQLQQVILNLLTNAIEAIADAGSVERRIILKTAVAGSDEVCLSVVDSGPGIDASRLSEVFEPFHSTKEEGMGLGLSLCRSLIEALGGRIEARQREGVGVELTFWLPAIEQP